VRPFIEELLRLYPHFRIGVFSSATVRTVNTALETLYAALQRITAQKGIGKGADTGRKAVACATVSRAVKKGSQDSALLLRCMQHGSASQRAWAQVCELTTEGRQRLMQCLIMPWGRTPLALSEFGMQAALQCITAQGLCWCTHRKGQDWLVQSLSSGLVSPHNTLVCCLSKPFCYTLLQMVCCCPRSTTSSTSSASGTTASLTHT
jgi:hypothetical protein